MNDLNYKILKNIIDFVTSWKWTFSNPEAGLLATSDFLRSSEANIFMIFVYQQRFIGMASNFLLASPWIRFCFGISVPPLKFLRKAIICSLQHQRLALLVHRIIFNFLQRFTEDKATHLMKTLNQSSHQACCESLSLNSQPWTFVSWSGLGIFQRRLSVLAHKT